MSKNIAALGATLLVLLGLAGCDLPYQPGVDGSRPLMPMNLRANAQPESPNSRPR